MSLIEREKLLEHLNACLAESDGKTPITDAVLVAIRCAVEEMPEVDAVPVVRCKDCKYRDPEDKKCDHGGLEHQGVPFAVADDYFCADGERRAEA